MIKKFKLKRLHLVAVAVFLVGAILFPLTKVFAVEASTVKVNNTIIFEGGSYNASHGVNGVSYDVPTNALRLSGGNTLESIYANGDLTIELTGGNVAIDVATSQIAVEVQGNLTIKGANGASLNIMTLLADDRAIEISAGSTLTIGDTENLTDLITVSIQRGRNVNTVDHTTVVAGNTYNYTEPGPGGPGGPGDPMLPPPGDPMTLSIGGTVVIDETVDPRVTSASGPGWSISQGFMGTYELNIDQGVTLGYITGVGDGSLSISGDGNIGENEDGLSINMGGRVNILGGMSNVAGDLNLAGGIYTQGELNTYDRAFTIGSAESKSTKGVSASNVIVHMGDLTIHTTGTALQHFSDVPLEGDGLRIESDAGKTLLVSSSNIATANVISARVSGGGTINLNYTGSLGTFTPEASHWPWTDMTGTEEENPLPTTVTCAPGVDTENKYRLTTGANSFLLESTAGTLYQLGWNIPDVEDSVVTNGTVRVIAANGYRFTSGGYTDYSIEAGSPVTIELLPDYGYQYVSGGLNGNQTQPEEGKASYSFIMPDGHLHLSAIFEPKSDTITVNDSAIKSATIAMPKNVINGNAELTINDTTDVDEAGFKTVAGSLTVADYLDLGLNEVINKGTTEESWKTPITELGEEMTVSVKLADQLQGYSDYTVLRDHNGTITKLASTFDATTGTLSFKTDAYSDYAIAYGAKATNPNTFDGIAPYIIASLASTVGIIAVIAIYLRRSRARA